jgi:hypothetical protein
LPRDRFAYLQLQALLLAPTTTSEPQPLNTVRGKLTSKLDLRKIAMEAVRQPHLLATEAHPDAGSRHNIRSIPTMAIFKGGQEISRISGARSASDIAQWVKQYL